jgi:hypothetical protein
VQDFVRGLPPEKFKQFLRLGLRTLLEEGFSPA